MADPICEERYQAFVLDSVALFVVAAAAAADGAAVAVAVAALEAFVVVVVIATAVLMDVVGFETITLAAVAIVDVVVSLGLRLCMGCGTLLI